MSHKKPIYVTQPSLPSLDEFYESLKIIWDSKWLTNAGPFHEELENKLAQHLGVKHLSLFSNGTLGLIVALQTLRITGEVITTPFSFVATTHSLWWNGIKPVFVDIEPNTFNIDVDKIEAAITPKTTAIMPVHVYGNPCDIKRIQEIADTYGLKVIYDAAHAFDVKVKGNSILNYGDLSILSFHATKVFNTIEGGAVICHDEKTKKRIDLLKNFGFADEVTVIEPGINAKMNEIQAAYGLLQLKNISGEIKKRKQAANLYLASLRDVKGIACLNDIEGVDHNYSYFPILITNDFHKSRDQVYEILKSHNIYSRRYFYPLISQFPTYKGLPSAAPANLPVAEDVSRKILCLPIFAEIAPDDIQDIVKLILNG